MRLKRNIISILVTAMILCNSSVFAGDDFIINTSQVSDNTVNISGKISSPNSKIYIEIVRQGKDIRDTDNIYMAKQVTADAYGEFSVNCEMPVKDRADDEKNVDGYFTVHAFAAGYEKEQAEFSYILKETETKFFEKLNSAKASAGDLKAFLENAEENKLIFDKYGIYIEEIWGLSEELKNKLCSAVAKTQIIFTKDNINELNELIIAMRLNGISDKETAKNVLNNEEIKSRYNLSFENFTYENLEQDVKDWFIRLFINKSGRLEFTKISELDLLFDESIVLNKINSAHYSKLYDILDENKNYLELEKNADFSKISLLSVANKERVMQELKKLSNEIVSISDLHDFIAQAYKRYNNNNSAGTQTGGGTGGGGGGGGASGGGGTGSSATVGAIVPQTTTTIQVEENKEYFNDLNGYEWAKEAVNKLAAGKIISGNGSGEFEPERNVTRAEFLKMLLGAMDLVNDDAVCNFDDVDKSLWCYKYIASAYELGITGGKSNTLFGTDDYITREEAAAFMHRTANRAYIPLSGDVKEKFSDYESISDWAKRSVEIMQQSGIINGTENNMFMPHDCTTRAQAAKMICGLFDLL